MKPRAAWDAAAMADALRTHLGGWGVLRKATPGMRNTPEIYDELVLRLGVPMPSRAVLPERLVREDSQVCYDNAARLWRRRKGLRYCEGYVFLEDCPIPVLHGWCLDASGAVVDPSVSNARGAVYYGMVYRDDYALAMWRRLRVKRRIGILPNCYLLCTDSDSYPAIIERGVLPQKELA